MPPTAPKVPLSLARGLLPDGGNIATNAGGVQVLRTATSIRDGLEWC